MELEVAKQFIKNRLAGHTEFMNLNNQAQRYYTVQNDILIGPQSTDDNPLRSADNRIAHSFYSLLVNQKAAYMFTAPPLFDVKDDTLNQLIADDLGDYYAKYAKDLCVNASNAGVAWLHYWVDDSGFHYGVVPSNQIIPIFDNKLGNDLIAVVRVYQNVDPADGKVYEYYEYWNDTQCEIYRRGAWDSDYNTFEEYEAFSYLYTDENGEVQGHDYGTPPFIPFYNNNICSRDLDLIKKLIDSYDKTYSGFMNDLEDIQEVIFILTNYSGENRSEFLQDLKNYKTVQFESMGADDKSGLSTLTIEIPVEARKEMLDITRKAIFDMGQGIDPQQQGLDGTSGEAMKFLYSLLELKAGMTETEFRLGFNKLVRAICKYHGNDNVGAITQTWTRTSIRNDAELVDMCSKSMGVVSRKTILKNHPFVDNVEDEEKELEDEKQQEYSDFVVQKSTVNTGTEDNTNDTTGINQSA